MITRIKKTKQKIISRFVFFIICALLTLFLLIIYNVNVSFLFQLNDNPHFFVYLFISLFILTIGFCIFFFETNRESHKTLETLQQSIREIAKQKSDNILILDLLPSIVYIVNKDLQII